MIPFSLLVVVARRLNAANRGDPANPPVTAEKLSIALHSVADDAATYREQEEIGQYQDTVRRLVEKRLLGFEAQLDAKLTKAAVRARLMDDVRASAYVTDPDLTVVCLRRSRFPCAGLERDLGLATVSTADFPFGEFAAWAMYYDAIAVAIDDPAYQALRPRHHERPEVDALEPQAAIVEAARTVVAMASVNKAGQFVVASQDFKRLESLLYPADKETTRETSEMPGV